jgi:hypothetical protein
MNRAEGRKARTGGARRWSRTSNGHGGSRKRHFLTILVKQFGTIGLLFQHDTAVSKLVDQCVLPLNIGKRNGEELFRLEVSI